VIFVAFLPLAVEIPALATLALATVAVWVLIVVETHSYGESRARLRREELGQEAAS
jgi:hypothetical protein